ncbi:hypothetical protein [Persephonella sp.]
MKRLFFLLAVLAVIQAQAQDISPLGKILFGEYCSKCHATKTTELTDNSSLKAPPIDVVVRQAKYYYRDLEKFNEYLVDYLHQPSEEKSVCIPCIKRWGIMPQMDIPDEEIQSIGRWLFKNFR